VGEQADRLGKELDLSGSGCGWGIEHCGLWIGDWGYRRLVAQKQSTLLTSISAHDNWHAHLRAINMQPMLTHLELS